MTTRERIDKMIERAKVERQIGFWRGYIAFGNELKLMVKPRERSINDEPI